MFSLNDKVLVLYKNKVYPGIIIDIEQLNEFSGYTNGGIREYNKLVYTGRYGIKFIGENPTLINVPYFWEKELTLLDN